MAYPDTYKIEVRYLAKDNVIKEDASETASNLTDAKKYFDRAVRLAFSEDYGQDEVWVQMFKFHQQIKFKSIKMPNPGRKHLTGKVSAKAQRAYEHILESGARYGKRAKEVAARTVRGMISEGLMNPPEYLEADSAYNAGELMAEMYNSIRIRPGRETFLSGFSKWFNKWKHMGVTGSRANALQSFEAGFRAKYRLGNGEGSSLINPSQIEPEMWVVTSAKGEVLGAYPKDWTEEAIEEVGQGFADQYKEHVIVMRKGEEFEHAHYFPKGNEKVSNNPSREQWRAVIYSDGHEYDYMYFNTRNQAGIWAGNKLKDYEKRRPGHHYTFDVYSIGKVENTKRKKNPSSIADAKALAEKWHGRPAKEIFEVVEKEIYDTNLAVLGELVELTLLDEDGYGTPISFDKSILLVGTVDENNMEFVGGNQGLPLSKLGIETDKHKVNLGQVFSIAYYTDKAHLQGEPKKAIEREHEFNEESRDGNYPELVYDTRNKHMELVGGSYIVTPEGIRD